MMGGKRVYEEENMKPLIVCMCMYVYVCVRVQLLLVCILKMKKNEFWGLFKISDLVKTTCPLIHVPQYTLIIHIF